jgi:nucleotide-binding universal stress UspA family protein
MPLVVVPVRYPLGRRSLATLAEAIDTARDRDADLTVMHVDLYQESGKTRRTALKRAVEAEFGALDRTRYVVRRGFLVEETIFDEVAAEGADVVVIGSKQVGRWRRALGRVLDEPDVDRFLRERLECDIVTVSAA